MFKWTKSLLQYPFQCVEWKVTSVKEGKFWVLSPQATFMFPWIQLSFIHKTQALNSLFRHLKTLACFYEPQFGRILLNIALSNFILEIKKNYGKRVKFDLPNYFSL